MSFPRSGSVTCAALLALTLAASGAGGAPAESKDPLTAEVERWVAYLKGNTATDEMWTQVKEASEPVLGRTETALRDGRRLLALQRLAVARVNLAASAYLGERTPEQRSDPAGFEAEWARLGKVLRGDLGAIPPGAFDGVQPAAVRALGEAALPQVRVYYEASLEYGRNTMPDSGLFYLGAAQAQRDFAVFCRSLAAPSPRRAPPLRALGPEIESLQHDFLAAYRPPISIDKHLEFILANSALNEARELDGAGLRYGALLRYLDAAVRFALLRPAARAPDADALSKRLRGLDARLSTGDTDHSLGRLFLEAAESDLAAPALGAGPTTAAAIAGDVLPRYFAALEAARPEPPKPAARVTVTLVRWPYT